ncbi:prepilin-type N-terminal cleavage/methylation domain-containing protein [Microbacterium sp. EYE_5]|uniref:prepilin-type N-terminal cleavage/methylation domain-containing protein n=1 Tax=unclassified Microbacterium TaxID=2609290 RepID=UPI0020061D0A|nr:MULTISPECIES: prepilin-type N-terminal cleavage/methylation domain-containing protein [unclassified Microbacterium]MCK6079371.1 prepilin-type N-terminal cleavage/methylation domain-containing protein [Microbacterium sp. EYE_382]MCK6084641.1 prepilin-type N-terminal cleavage/methylation domain-containing protein [Microbacterium sp. EYE_384]MCK6123130.1 prepilin-type N-terminal cleavage/methylation domain-containing protein [Microbacterium sp. EYE_80]MCK6125405.1 prepilin-type N-terminal cleav
MKNYLDALKRRKEETGESGFSLIELIVVVVILGVLAAIAIPIFNGLQADAEENALKTVAANGASQVATMIANGDTVTATSADNLEDSDITVAVSGTTLEGYCVTATKTGSSIPAQSSGPGCP